MADRAFKGTGITSGRDFVGYRVSDNLIYPVQGLGYINDRLFSPSEFVPSSDEEGFFYCPVVKCNDISPWDGSHSFDELHHHRAVLFSLICRLHRSRAGKSKLHSDGTMHKGMFIVWINTPVGPSSYHFKINPYWALFDVPVQNRAPIYDGCLSEESLKRLQTLPVLDINHVSICYAGRGQQK